ncbi:hypothetical protein KCP73_21790 [Salmonella enterica subsp. enterica]|nr:hypothetical protein KCP73_21790 [Salmonella enterica subsp. enterica]
MPTRGAVSIPAPASSKMRQYCAYKTYKLKLTGGFVSYSLLTTASRMAVCLWLPADVRRCNWSAI